METKNIAILAICLVGIALIGVNICQHQQIKKTTQETPREISSDNEATTEIIGGSKPASPNDTTKGPAFASGEGQSMAKEAEDLAYHLDAAEEELEMVNKQLSEEEAKKAEQRKIQRELQKRSRESPSFKSSMKRSLDVQYADLYKKLNLSSEKLDKFKDLLVEEMMAQQDIYLDYDDIADLSKEQHEELQRRYMEITKEYEPQYADILGQDNYEIYRRYEETQGERYNVNNYIETLNSDEKLSESQKESLIKAMNDEIQNITWEKVDDDSETSSSRYDEKNLALMLANYNLRIDAYSKAGYGILTASQIEKFNTYLQKERDQFKLYIEMSALRYGPSTTQKSTENGSD